MIGHLSHCLKFSLLKPVFSVLFQILSHVIIVCFAMYFPEDFTPDVQVSVDKFFQNVTLALSEKYR